MPKARVFWGLGNGERIRTSHKGFTRDFKLKMCG